MISTRIKSYMNREGEESRLAREREPNCKKSGIHPSVEEEGRRGGGEAPWRGRRELFAWCSAEPRRWGRDCAEEVGGGLVARMNTEYGEEIWRVCWIVPKFEEEIFVK